MSAAASTFADWLTELEGIPAAAPLRLTVEFYAPACFGVPKGFDGWRMARHAISFATGVRLEIVRHTICFEQEQLQRVVTS